MAKLPHGQRIDLIVTELIANIMSEESKLISELTELWYQDRANDQQSPLRESSLRNIEIHREHIRSKLGHLRIGELKESDCAAFIESPVKEGRKVTPKTMERRQSYLLQFIYWCLSKKHLEINPMLNAKRIHIPSQPPAYLSVDNCVSLLTLVVHEFDDVLGYLALTLFCGTGWDETEKLKWENLDFEKNDVFVPAAVANNNKDRHHQIPENARICLMHYKETGYVLLIPRGFRGSWQKLKMHLEFPWCYDALKHTFAVYHYALHKNAQTLSEYLGVDPELIVKQYQRDIPSIEVRRFWTLSTNTKGVKPKPLF